MEKEMKQFINDVWTPFCESNEDYIAEVDDNLLSWIKKNIIQLREFFCTRIVVEDDHLIKVTW